jgi:hypothetical protein
MSYKEDLKLLDEWTSIPFPEEIHMSPHWKGRSDFSETRMRSFSSHEEVVLHAQSDGAAFEARKPFIKRMIMEKIAEIFNSVEGLPENFLLPGESGKSERSSVGLVNGIPVSNTYLWNLFFFRSIEKFFGRFPKKVIEFGSGYGGLARIVKTMRPDVEYTLVDIPASLFQAFCFLKANGITENVNFIPLQKFLELEGEFDLLINTGSLGEVPCETVEVYLKNIRRIAPKFFYSFNYKEENHNPRQEMTWAKTPTVEGYEEVLSRMDPITVKEGLPRNRLELIQKRTS